MPRRPLAVRVPAVIVRLFRDGELLSILTGSAVVPVAVTSPPLIVILLLAFMPISPVAFRTPFFIKREVVSMPMELSLSLAVLFAVTFPPSITSPTGPLTSIPFLPVATMVTPLMVRSPAVIAIPGVVIVRLPVPFITDGYTPKYIPVPLPSLMMLLVPVRII